MTDRGVVRAARPVAVAETAGAENDTTVIVRVRQNGENELALTFYRVDDYTGTIDGRRPDQAGYDAPGGGRAYQLGSGGTSLSGPGYGNFEQTGLLNVDAGDLIAMKLSNNSYRQHLLGLRARQRDGGGPAMSAISGTTASTRGAGKTRGAAAIATSTT